MLLKALKFFNSFPKKERIIFLAAAFVFLISLIIALVKISQSKTTFIPVEGGEFIEGVVGQPVFINPLFSGNNEVDNSLVKMLFSDLRSLSDNYKESEDGTIIDIRLREDIFWQDSQPITSDDVIFTINAIENSGILSPLALSWKGIKAERISEREIKIDSPNKYAYFKNIVLGLRLIPKHIFGSIPVENIRLSNYNLEPISSGPFKFDGLETRRDGFITGYYLAQNDKYFGKKPYLKKFSFKFYANEEDLISAFNSGEINGFNLTRYEKSKDIIVPHETIEIKMPRYYAIFINQFNNPLLKDKNLRIALDWAIDKKQIIEKIFSGRALLINGPIFEKGINTANEQEFSPEKSKKILISSGWQQNEKGVWTKTENEKIYALETNLTVHPTPFLMETAKLIQEDWQKIGIKTNIINTDSSTFNKEILEPRNYEMLIFGNIYGETPDPFSFWHSSQKFAPGLNLSLYEDENADYLIETSRTELDPEKRFSGFSKLQSLIYEDKPAIFLYSPYYIYIANKSLRGFEDESISLPSDHLQNIVNWHVKTARVFK